MGIFDTAIEFATIKHQNQTRKNDSKIPYITHPLSVANRIRTIGGVNDETVLCSAVLHDTLEDTNTTQEELIVQFGEEIANIVSEVTDDKSLDKLTRKQMQVNNSSYKSFKAKLVKLADFLDNLSTMREYPPITWDQARIDGYFVWAWYVVQGLRGTNANLEFELDKLFVNTDTSILQLDNYYKSMESIDD